VILGRGYAAALHRDAYSTSSQKQGQFTSKSENNKVTSGKGIIIALIKSFKLIKKQVEYPALKIPCPPSHPLLALY
jgi:hypothetical protein